MGTTTEERRGQQRKSFEFVIIQQSLGDRQKISIHLIDFIQLGHDKTNYNLWASGFRGHAKRGCPVVVVVVPSAASLHVTLVWSGLVGLAWLEVIE